MKIRDLIRNGEFSFNVDFRIYRYDVIPFPDGTGFVEERDKVADNSNVPEWVLDKWITAINQGDDGILEIEFVDLIQL